MSYKRAWDLVEQMNTSFRMPLVTTSTGGPSGGGSRLTETGEAVLAAFRAIEATTTAAASDKLRELAALLPPATRFPPAGPDAGTAGHAAPGPATPVSTRPDRDTIS